MNLQKNERHDGDNANSLFYCLCGNKNIVSFGYKQGETKNGAKSL